MDHTQIQDAVGVLSKIVEASCYVSKERFDLAAKVKYNIDDPQRLDRLYGLYNKACQTIRLFEREELKQELFLAVDIALAAYPGPTAFYKHVPALAGYGDNSKDLRKYFYVTEGDIVHEAEVNLRDATSIHLLSELLDREDVQLWDVVPYLGELKRNDKDKRVPYFEGDIVFLYGDPGDRFFYDYYRTDAGVYIATDEGWRKLQYVPHRGYLGKDGEPEYENDNHYTDHEIEDNGRGFRFVGNIHKHPGVLVDRGEE